MHIIVLHLTIPMPNPTLMPECVERGCTVWTRSIWSASRPARYGHVHIVPYLKLPRVQSDLVVCAFPARARLSQLLEPVAPSPGVRVHGAEGKQGALLTGIGVHFSDQGHQFSEGTVKPEVVGNKIVGYHRNSKLIMQIHTYHV